MKRKPLFKSISKSIDQDTPTMKFSPIHRIAPTALVFLCVFAVLRVLSDSPSSVTMKGLQGQWEGFLVGGETYGTITLKITNNQLHFYRDETHWFKTTIVLPEDSNPQQLHATIQDCPTEGIIGEVVYSILKIEQDTLVFAGKGDSVEDLPSVFEGPGIMRHEFRKALPKQTKVDLGPQPTSSSENYEGPSPGN